MMEVEGNLLTPDHYVARRSGPWATAGEQTQESEPQTSSASIVYNIICMAGLATLMLFANNSRARQSILGSISQYWPVTMLVFFRARIPHESTCTCKLRGYACMMRVKASVNPSSMKSKTGHAFSICRILCCTSSIQENDRIPCMMA